MDGLRPVGTVYIDARSDTDTGGPEAMLQLALTLRAHKLKVRLFPGRSTAKRFFVEYPDLKQIYRGIPRGRGDDIVVIPEFPKAKCIKYGNATTFIWLLQNMELTSEHLESGCVYVAHNKAIAARYNLTTIRPYLTPSTVQFCKRRRRLVEQRKHVLLDGDVPEAVRQAMPRAILVKGFNRSMVHHLIARTKVVIDWNFVGSERLPIEAVLCGARLFTSREENNCALGDDFQLDRASIVNDVKDLSSAIESRLPEMKSMIDAFEYLNPDTMWDDAKIALRLSREDITKS